jgi:hypothetical protein
VEPVRGIAGGTLEGSDTRMVGLPVATDAAGDALLGKPYTLVWLGKYIANPKAAETPRAMRLDGFGVQGSVTADDRAFGATHPRSRFIDLKNYASAFLGVGDQDVELTGRAHVQLGVELSVIFNIS